MADPDVRAVAERFWTAIATGDWAAAAALLHDDFVEEWPQSGERIVGRDDALAIDRNYPGGAPAVSIRRISTGGDLAVVELLVTYGDGSRWHAVSVLRVRDGKVVHEIDYFGRPFRAPQWRAEWVDRVEP
jgi:ketosteroid isomerase-like protein